VLQPAETTVRENKFWGDCLHNAAIALSRVMFFVAMGMLIFVWPRFQPGVEAPTLTLYAWIVMFLMSPLDQIMGTLPSIKWAAIAIGRIDNLGLMLREAEIEEAEASPLASWHQIELAGVTHAYRREGRAQGFVLGPINLTVRPGEILFVIGGNGSGKTTLAKLLTGLYVPEEGEILLDGQPVTAENRESYRQLFSVVFDDAAVFASLWGLEASDLDQRACEYLRQLELDHVVSVSGGEFSTTSLSRGQRKRLALLTAYLEDRPIYVFDEWAADQDPVFRRVFYLRILPELKRRGKAVVAVTHDDRYFAAADCVIKLDEGKIVESLLPEAYADAAPMGHVSNVPVTQRHVGNVPHEALAEPSPDKV
jgi:putative ATP-binding cassette transporter